MLLEKIIDNICWLLSKIPLECMELHFMQMALLAVLLITPLAAAAGVQVVNFRMAFFADTIGHSAFAGAALGLILLGSQGPAWSMPLLAMLIGLGVMWLKRSSEIASDTAIGILFAFIVSGGLLLTAHNHELSHLAQRFIFGDVLLIDYQDIVLLMILFILHTLFMLCNSNRMLALIVIVCVKAVGVLLVSALLVVPAAAARNLTTKAGMMVWYASLCGLLCGISGLLLSVHEKINTASGALIVMLNCIVFAVSILVKKLRKTAVEG